ncbi:VOC family protein [Rhodococcus chondri]|uniref:VOC family protein n=1 Tax=Rhodococcus chondri TaxID=3065941 RepID=A0ABU7JYC0_9NOCA|nr:VOC family protein [Rhodococcus sp. CC-R104]MEE2035010.1 VOC family protein [Rhodococcus sp. CC-R104]
MTTTSAKTSANPETKNTDNRASRVWPCLAYTDARAAIRFLVETLGFTESAVYGDGDRVDHAELTWPYGGGVMLGSAGRDTPIDQHTDNGSVYLVVPDDATADALYDKVRESDATVTVELRDEDYGSHGFTCRDPHGVYWSIGTYPGQGRSGE